MSPKDSKKLRNIALAGHGGSGKTTLISGILYKAGITDRFGKVDDGNAITDFQEGEIKRKISLSVAAAHTTGPQGTIHIVDTPGFGDFLPEGLAALQIIDSTIIVVCGVSGVETNTYKVWDELNRNSKPRMIVINKMDRENASFERALKSLQEAFGSGFVPIHFPMGKESDFIGIIDLITMKAFKYSDDESGNYSEMDIPSEYEESVSGLREQLLETVAESDEQLLEKWFEGESLSTEEIHAALLKGIQKGELFPVLTASGLKNIGTSHLVEAAFDLLPSPYTVPPFIGRTDPEDDSSEEIIRQTTPEEPFSAVVFKTVLDPYAGRISLSRVVSGAYSMDQVLHNATKESNEKASAMAYMNGKIQTPTKSITAGDVVAFLKLKNTNTGDTLTNPETPIIFKAYPYPAPVISFAVQPKTKSDEDKISAAMGKLEIEDPTLEIRRHPQTKEILFSGVGQLHVETTVEKLQTRYSVGVALHTPKIPYKETISGNSDVRYRHKKQTGGAGQFGEVAIRTNPLPRGEGFLFTNKIVGGVIPGTFIPSVEKGILSSIEKGPLAGFPVVDLEVTLYDGKSHPVDSKDIAFQIAGSKAIKDGVMKAKPILLEPIMNLKITISDDCMGDVMGDLNSRRGRVQGMDSAGGRQIINAQVPHAEILRYVSDLRSITADRGYFEMEFSHYEEVPSQLATKVIEKARAGEE